jgi:hypothetical protein
MRPRTKLPIPKPGRSQFRNFDRLVGILITKKPVKKESTPERRATDQDALRERLPRP